MLLVAKAKARRDLFLAVSVARYRRAGMLRVSSNGDPGDCVGTQHLKMAVVQDRAGAQQQLSMAADGMLAEHHAALRLIKIELLYRSHPLP